MKRFPLVIALLTLSLALSAQKTKTVSGTYIYVVPETESLQQAQTTAVQRAQTQILADSFGTAIDLAASTSITDNGISTRSISQSTVKGEWLETIGTPVLTTLFNGDQLAIKVEITGKIREITASRSDFSAKVLCGMPDLRFQSDSFHSGEDLFLWFQAPEDGFLSIYLYDGADTVYCLLPYRRQSNGSYPVKGGKPYFFFSQDFSDGLIPADWIDEYTLSAERELEINKLYLVYSPHRFTKALDSESDMTLPRVLSFQDFQKWLSKVLSEDNLACMKTVSITISSRS